MDHQTNIKEIAHILSEIDDIALIEDFLKNILTETELKNLASRWEIVKLLDQGISQRKIARDLHLSLCKITRGSKVLKEKNSAVKKLIHKNY
jgi:TrpR family trp operon transcriptional repressor